MVHAQDLVALQTLCTSLAIFPSLQPELAQNLSLSLNHLLLILPNLNHWTTQSISMEMSAQTRTEIILFVLMAALVAGHGRMMIPTSGNPRTQHVDACLNNVRQKAILTLVTLVDQDNKAHVMDAVAAAGAILSMILLNGALPKECVGASLMNSSLSSNTVVSVKTSMIMNVVKTVTVVFGHGRSMIPRNGRVKQLRVDVLQVRFEKSLGVKEFVKTSTTKSAVPIVLTAVGLGKPLIQNAGEVRPQPVAARTGDSN